MKKLLQLILLAVCLWITLPLCGEVILPPGTPVFSDPAHNQKIVAVAEQAAGEVESLPEVRSKVFVPWGCGQ